MYRNSIDTTPVNSITSNIYKKVIFIPNTVELKIRDRYLFVIGKLGKLTHKLHKSIDVYLRNLNHLDIFSKSCNINNKALVGTTCSLINGMIIGVTLGFVKKLQLVGVGYRVSINKKNNVLNLIIGLSHSVNYKLPEGIEAQCLNQVEIILTGFDKQLIGQVAADLRAIRPPEPFKGKGIRYADEIIRNKDAKKK